MNAPACRTCGQLLRWIPESNGWGCDRCRQFFPVNAPAPAAAPPPPAYPAPPPHAAPPGYGAPMGAAPQPVRAGGKSKTPILIAVAVLVLAGGGVAAFLLLRGGGDGGGASTPEAVIKATLAAETAGDADALVNLVNPKGMIARAFECKGDAEDDNDMDPEKMIRKTKRQMTELVETTKGLKVKLVSTEKGESEKSLEKGEKEDGCTAKHDLRVVTYELELELEDADGNKGEQTAEIRLFDVGGKWFLMSPPELKIGPNYKAIIKEMEKFRDEMCACKDTACSQKVSDKFDEWSKKMAAETKDEKPSDELMDKVMPVVTAYMDCETKLRSAYDPPPPPDPTPVPTTPPVPSGPLAEAPAGMPQECIDLRAMVVKLSTCDGYYGKDAIASSWQGIVDAWSQLPAESRAVLGTSCTSALDVLKQGAPANCL